MKIQFHDLNEERPTKDGDYLLCFVKTFHGEEKTYHAVASWLEHGKFSDYVEKDKNEGDVYWAEMPTPKELREDW